MTPVECRESAEKQRVYRVLIAMLVFSLLLSTSITDNLSWTLKQESKKKISCFQNTHIYIRVHIASLYFLHTLLSSLRQTPYKICCFWKPVNLFFNLESGGDTSRIQNAVAFGKKNNNEIPRRDGRVRPRFHARCGKLSSTTSVPGNTRFGGFCGAVDVRFRRRPFPGQCGRCALGEEITRQFDFGIFAVSNGTGKGGTSRVFIASVP